MALIEYTRCWNCGHKARNFCSRCAEAQPSCPPDVLARANASPTRAAFLRQVRAELDAERKRRAEDAEMCRDIQQYLEFFRPVAANPRGLM